MGSGFAAGAGANMLQQVLHELATRAFRNRELDQQSTRDEAALHHFGAMEQEATAQTDMQRQRLEAELQPKAPEPPKPPAVHIVGGRLVDDNGNVKYESPAPPEKPAPPQRPMSVAPGGTLVDPATGKTIYKSPDRPREAPTATVQTVDENGNPVTKFVKKQEGASYLKPANATTATRVASAQTVNEVGSDIIKKLSEPNFRAAVGPILGRSGTLRDFIGNPPPEFSELAGQIESYALANMGVHGMRSAQGAQQISKLLDQHHTPESLAATIRGLNDFSTRFVEHNQPKSGKPAAAGANNDPLGIR